jgi:hypothetical protein
MEVIMTRLDGTQCKVLLTEEDMAEGLAMVSVRNGNARVFIGFQRRRSDERLQQWRELTESALGEVFADAW